MTLKDAKGGVVSVHVDETFDVKNLSVAAQGEVSAKQLNSRFTVALRHVGPTGTSHAPPVKPGTYDVFVSVGQRDGTPRLALPLPDSDGLGHYKVGQIVLK